MVAMINIKHHFNFSDEVTKADGTTYKTRAEMHNEVVGKEKREAIEAERLKNSESADEKSTKTEAESEVETGISSTC